MTKFERVPKKTIFVVCEGKSELGYMRALNVFLSNRSPPCPAAITAFSASGGSAAAIIEQGLKEIERRRKKKDERFDATYALLDREPHPANVEKLEAATRIAKKRGLKLIWQPGTHEEFLRLHFSAAARPKKIEDAWPGYRKGHDAAFYAKNLTAETYAFARESHADFDEFLTNCAFPPHAAGA